MLTYFFLHNKWNKEDYSHITETNPNPSAQAEILALYSITQTQWVQYNVPQWQLAMA